MRRLFAAVAALTVLAVPSTNAGQSDRARTESLARRATDRLQTLQREAERLASEERTLLGDVRKLEIERQIKTEDIARIDANASSLNAELDATTARIADLEALEQVAGPQLRARLVEIYK